jgi:hypothetical protein
MHFDPDTARRILLELEARPANAPARALYVADVNEDELYEYLDSLIDAGFVVGMVKKDGTGRRRIALALPSHLTYAGHEFLADTKIESVWQKTKTIALEKGGQASFAILATIAKQVARQHFGLPM